MDPIRHIRFSLLILVVVILFGTAGYIAIEEWSFFDALYMTVITLATVGYREVNILSDGGRVFTLVLILFGAGIIAYAVGSLIQLVVEGQLQKVLGRKKLEKQISQLKGHYVICGYGRIGQLICDELHAKPIPFVVVENDEAHIEKLDKEGYLFVHGDATDDDTLIAAGIQKAKGLITVVASDTANVYITLSARGLNKDLFILARASEKSSEKKLIRAGASKVVSPYTIGATRMAQAIVRPSVVDFIDIATGGQNLELQLDEITITQNSRLAGTTLITSGIRKEMGIIIIGIKKSGKKMIFNPASSTDIEAGDILITLGKVADTRTLEKIAAGTSNA